MVVRNPGGTKDTVVPAPEAPEAPAPEAPAEGPKLTLTLSGAPAEGRSLSQSPIYESGYFGEDTGEFDAIFQGIFDDIDNVSEEGEIPDDN